MWSVIKLYYLGTLYNYRLLMRPTHDHEDRVRYWLTDAVPREVLVDRRVGQPILDKVFVIMIRPKSKVYYCFIKLSGLFFTKTDTFIIIKICLLLVKQLPHFYRLAKIRTPITPQITVCVVLTQSPKTWQAQEKMVSTLEQMQVPKWYLFVI